MWRRPGGSCPQHRLRLGQPVLRPTVIALQDGGRSEAGEPDRFPPGTSDLSAEFDGTSGVMARPVEPTGPHRPQPEDRVGGGKVEGDFGGLANLDRLLEQAAPGVDRATAKQRQSGDRQDIGVSRTITALLGVFDRFLDVSVHLLAGRQPRRGSRLAPNNQTERQRPAHVSAACRVDRLARRPIGAGRLAAAEGQERRGGQTPHSLVITGVWNLDRVVQASAHLCGQAALKPEADDRLGDAQEASQVPALRRPVHRGAQVVEVGRQPRHPQPRLSTVETDLRLPGQPDMELQMAVTHPGGILQLGQSLPRIHPDRLQQPVAGPALTLDDLQQ